MIYCPDIVGISQKVDGNSNANLQNGDNDWILGRQWKTSFSYEKKSRILFQKSTVDFALSFWWLQNGDLANTDFRS